jgi:hypothetical protein
MPSRKRDLTTSTDPRFGPWKPMRGARGQAEAVQQNIGSPYRTKMPNSPLVPSRRNLLKEGPGAAVARKSGGWRA